MAMARNGIAGDGRWRSHADGDQRRAASGRLTLSVRAEVRCQCPCCSISGGREAAAPPGGFAPPQAGRDICLSVGVDRSASWVEQRA